MSDAYQRHREAYLDVSSQYRVLATDTGAIPLVPAPVAPAATWVQKIHVEVTVAAASEVWTFQDGSGTLIVPMPASVAGHTDIDFGPSGVPCAAATAFQLVISGATGATGRITWEAYQRP